MEGLFDFFANFVRFFECDFDLIVCGIEHSARLVEGLLEVFDAWDALVEIGFALCDFGEFEFDTVAFVGESLLGVLVLFLYFEELGFFPL